MQTSAPFPLPWYANFAAAALASKARGAAVLELMQTPLPETEPEPRALVIARPQSKNGT